MTVAVASGKGGTGKTTVAVSLALVAAPVTLVDADVEEPNANILLKAERHTVKKAQLPFPKINAKKCDFCEKCSQFCAFNAIVVLRGLKVFVVPEMCKSCGGCAIVCPQKAISEEPRDIGYIRLGNKDGVRLVEGELLVGESSPTPLIRMLPAFFDGGDVIIDCPPGAAHSMVEAIRPADIVLLVTEPTPFGLHDLEEALVAADALRKRCAVVVNKSDIGTDEVKRFAELRGIPVLMEIPYDDKIARWYSRGQTPAEASSRWRERFAELWRKLKEMSA